MKYAKELTWLTLSILCCLGAMPVAHAHHVLGRPAYSLSEESNTPPSMQVETQIGNYSVTYTAFPAFPKPNEGGRVNLVATHMDTSAPYIGNVTFKVRDDSWFSRNEEVLGTQKIDDGVYRQGFVFKKAGDYIITAEFEADNEPYVIDFPLRIGKPFPIGPIGISAIVILLVLVGVNLTQRKRLHRLKAKQHHADVT